MITTLAVIGTGWISYKSFFSGVTVIVNNATGGDINNLRIKFTGGSQSSPYLKAAEFWEIKANPTNVSHLEVEFADSSGKQHSANIGVYFERNYRGAIRVTIEPDGKVTWEDEIKI